MKASSLKAHFASRHVTHNGVTRGFNQGENVGE